MASATTDPLLLAAQQARMALRSQNIPQNSQNIPMNSQPQQQNIDPATCPLPDGNMETEAPETNPLQAFSTIIGLNASDCQLLNRFLSTPVKPDDPPMVNYYRMSMQRFVDYLTTDLGDDDFRTAVSIAQELVLEVRAFCNYGVPGLKVNSFFKNPSILENALPALFPPAKSDGFTLASSKRRKRRTSAGSASSAEGVATKNKFSVLSNNQSEMESDAGPSNSSQTAPAVPKSTVRKPPPIFIDYPEKWTDLESALELVTPDGFDIKTSGEYIAISPHTIDDYRVIQKYIAEHGIKHQAIPPKEDRPIKILVKGLAPTVETDELRVALEHRGFEVRSIGQKRVRGKKLDQFLVNFAPNTKIDLVLKIDRLFHCKVQLFRHRPDGSNLCYNCQRFGHHSSTCTMSPRCMKCAEGHQTRDCKKPKGTPCTCCNCGGSHPSSHRGCPVNPINKNSEESNVNTAPKATSRTFVPASAPAPRTRSFAAAAATSAPAATSQAKFRTAQQPSTSSSPPQTSLPAGPSACAAPAGDITDPHSGAFWTGMDDFYQYFSGLLALFGRVGFHDAAGLFEELSRALRGKTSVNDQICAAFSVYVSRMSQSPAHNRG